MSDLGDDLPEPSEASGPSNLSADPLDDEERTAQLLKSLINPTGLQSAWQKVGKRLRLVEQKLARVMAAVEKLPEQYVPIEAYKETVEVRHSQTLADQAIVLERIGEVSARLESTVMEETVPQVAGALAKLEEQAGHNRKMQGQAEFLTNRLHEARDDYIARIGAVNATLGGRLGRAVEDVEGIKSQSHHGFEQLSSALGEQEQRLLEFTRNEVASTMDQMLHFEPEKPTERQMALMNLMNDNLVEPLKADLEKTKEKLGETSTEVERQEHEFTRLINATEKKIDIMATTSKQARDDMKVAIELRPRREEFDELSGGLNKKVDGLSTNLESLQTHTVLKMNEFVDHFGQLHEMLDDHEHCLKHHAEELENRSTKYDLLVCQGQIEKCAIKDEVDRELSELQKVVGWQTNKIENFGLSIQMANQGKGPKTKKKKVASRGPVSQSSSVMSAAPGGTDDTQSDNGAAQVEESAQGGSDSMAAIVEAVAEPESPVKRDSPHAAAEEEHEDEEEEEAEEDDIDDEDSPNALLLKEQLEGLSMATVGLAHLCLREPKLGASRQARLEQEKELLEQLKNLRHWITHKAAPSGWKPETLVTAALRCTHPVDAADPGPLPQVSLRGIMAKSEAEAWAEARTPAAPSLLPTSLSAAPALSPAPPVPRGPERRHLSADAPRKFGMKTAPSCTPRAPSTARPHHLARGLPPLRAVAA